MSSARSCKLYIWYLSGGREREADALNYLVLKGLLKLQHYKLGSSSRGIGGLLVEIYKMLVKLLRGGRPQVILLESPGVRGLVAYYIALIFNIKLIVRVKGDLWSEYSDVSLVGSLKDKIKKIINYNASIKIMSRADMILPISESIADIVRSNIKGVNVIVVGNHVIEDSAREDSMECDKQALHSSKYVLTVTNFNFYKKYVPLSKAVRMYAESLNLLGYVWIILGDGIFYNKFNSDMADIVDRGHVIIKGYCSAKRYYRHASALLYFSNMDGLPNVLLESYENRLPVIINSTCPAIEFVIDKVTGLIVDLDDEPGMVKVINDIDKDEFKMLGENGYNYCHDNFSLDKISNDIYNAIIDGVEGGR